MTYRDDLDALKLRYQQLASDLADLRAKQRFLQETTERLESLEKELKEVREQLERKQAKRALPMLDQVKIASPCSESWDEMIGDERTRFCLKCEKNVYNVAAMTRDEAQQLIDESEGTACMRLYRRKDGTVITSDCPVGVRRKRVTRIAAAALAVGGAGLAFLGLAPGAQPMTGAVGYDVNMGEPAVEMGDVEQIHEVEQQDVPALMGSVAPTAPPPPAPRDNPLPTR